jgi:malonyl-CoA O-methyltransferase
VNHELALDKRLLRRAFEKAAAGYDAAAVLQHEICRRMLARLEYIKHRPAAILDAGSGTGNVVAALRVRYPQATLYALDIALAMVRRSRARAPWWRRLLGRGVLPVCGDIERLPLRDAAVGMVWSNLALQWVNDAPRTFAEFRRVLAPGGLLMFSTFGPDTLKELRAAYRGTDRYTHINRFIDMHDLGDMLVHGGFADPVMDMEYMTLTYTDVLALMNDLKAIGAHNVTAGRRQGMTARATLAAVKCNYEALRRDGRLPATFEVIYGHAWVPQPRTTADGKTVIPIKVSKGSPL